MKTINKLIILLSCAGWMACSDGLPDQDSQKPEEKGEPVNILFTPPRFRSSPRHWKEGLV